MTSREVTSPLPRSETVNRRIREKSAADWFYILLFGCIGWPWLLKSLHGGTPKERAALLSRIGLPAHALPNLGSWKADVGFLGVIADHIAQYRPRVVVEFGAGASTLVAAQALKRVGAGELLSFDEHADFVDATRRWLAEYGLNVDLRHAPLTRKTREWPGRWYDHGALPESIDMLIVDGPHWAVHPFVRGAADGLFNRIPSGGIVLLDDAARPGERIVGRRWRRRWTNFEFSYVKAGMKGALVGRRL